MVRLQLLSAINQLMQVCLHELSDDVYILVISW